MKRILLSTVFAVSTIFLFAQRGIEAGALVQPQIYGQLYGENEPDKAIKIPYSFAIGANVGYNFTNNFGLRTGFMYSPQGEKYSKTSTAPEQSIELNLEYIQVPLYLKLNSSVDRKISYILLLGPHVSYLNNAQFTLDSNDPESVLGDYNRVLFGASASVGIQLNLDQGGNINFLWRSAASIDQVQSNSTFLSRNISTGLQLAYHYFITI